MRGTTYRKRKPDGSYTRWYAVIDLPSDANGKRRQKTTTHDTKREAQAWLAKTAQELRAGEVYDTTVSVAEYLAEWLNGKQALRPSTRVDYERHIRDIFIPELGHLRLLDLRPHHIDAIFHRLAEGNRYRERPVGAQTMHRVLATLNSALNAAVRRGLIRRNPAATVELPRATPAQPRVWTRDEAAAFLTGTTNDRLHTLYRLLVLTGLRRGEAVGIQWGDLDLSDGTLTVNRQVVSVTGELVVGPPKSDAGRRTVALDRVTRQLLEAQHRRALLASPWATDEVFATRFVFTRVDGQCLTPTHVSRRFDTLVRQLGLPRIRLHDLRHTSASLGLAGGESLLQVSRRLGHSSITITADVYAHVPHEEAQQSADRLASRLDA